jgi:hypothetical protein
MLIWRILSKRSGIVEAYSTEPDKIGVAPGCPVSAVNVSDLVGHYCRAASVARNGARSHGPEQPAVVVANSLKPDLRPVHG